MENYTYDYTKTMMMKLAMASTNKQGVSDIHADFPMAMDIIRKVDFITQGIPKIVYLVGWQYAGSDDKYPDFFEVNDLLKRPEDDSGYDSLLWLISEARKYNTIVSFHINFNDAYDDAPSYEEFKEKNALIRKKNGKPWPMERYNGRTCYKTSFKEYWESGLFKRQIDRLLELFPIEEQGTLHVDNFQCYTNYAPLVTISEMQRYRDKMIGYLREYGIDITTEFTCREHNELHNKTLLGTPRDHNPSKPIDILGKIPAVWWQTYFSNQELVDINPKVLGGGMLRNGTKYDARQDFIYGNMHGEDRFGEAKKSDDSSWATGFTKDFATIQVPYNFLCEHKRLSIDGKKGNYSCTYADNVISYQKGRKILFNGNVIKDADNLCIPFVLKDNSAFAYSETGDTRSWHVGDYSVAAIYDVTANGNKLLGETPVTNQLLKLDIKPKQSLFIELQK